MKGKFLSRGILLLVAALAVVAGALSSRLVARAQAIEPQTFVVQAGAGGFANGELLGFAPQSLQIHRGDTITWVIASFHDIHFANEPAPLVVESDVNGQKIPILNPAIANRSVESGSTYTGGDVNSGLPLAESTVFSLVIDLEPGTYSYLCDAHPGMVAVLSVVDNSTVIPSPSDVSFQAENEIGATIRASMDTFNALSAAMPMTTEGDTLNVQAGSEGALTLNNYFPRDGIIHAGESVTWTVPTGSFDPHTISSPSLLGQDFTPLEVEGQKPVFVPGAAVIPTVASGGEVGANTPYNSGVILPGQSYTLTFTEPGVYTYFCSLHIGMQGTIIVEPKA